MPKITTKKKPPQSIDIRKFHIFCISLKDAKQRRRDIISMSQNKGLTTYFIDAIDGRQLSRKALQQQTQIPIEWNALGGHTDEINLTTEAACCLSHIKTWRTILKYNLDNAIIIEDDVSLQRLRNIIIPDQADFVYLSNRANFNSDYEVHGPVSGSEAYYLTKGCCKKLLKIFSKITMPVDVQWLPQMQSLTNSKHVLSVFTNQSLPMLNAYVDPGIFSLNRHSQKSQILDKTYND